LLGLKVEHWGITATPDGEARLKYPIKVDLTGRKVLVVDDITDTGKSMMTAVSYVKTLNPEEIKTAALLHIKDSKFVPDYYAEEIEWKWIIFPWNVTEDLINLISNYLNEKKMAEINDVIDGLKQWYDIELDENQINEVIAEMELRNLAKLDKEKGMIVKLRCRA
jgi:hypoxanthine phosphoribosyltransferase